MRRNNDCKTLVEYSDYITEIKTKYYLNIIIYL